MNFHEALEYMATGGKVAGKSWEKEDDYHSRKGACIFIRTANPTGGINPIISKEEVIKHYTHLVIAYPDGRIIPGVGFDVYDMLNEDWVKVKK